ncbi:AAA family ATPase [Nocardia sp. NPDC127579]|uniref:nucleotide-binding protein n=1 Tax=Nocardia sp. NPDC127579 TaxID=3345402 RepID=UPI003624DB2E
MSRNNDSLPMLPPWLAESDDGGGGGYEAPVQNLPHDDLIDDSPRRKEKKKRKGLFGRDKEAPVDPAPEPRSDSWSQPQPQEEVPRGGSSWSGAEAWTPDAPRRPGPPAPPHPADVRPPEQPGPPPGLPTRHPGEHRESFQPLGQHPGAPDPMPSNEATTRYTRPEPEAAAPRPELPARLPEPPARLPEPPARPSEPAARLPEPPARLPDLPLPESPTTGERPYLPGPPPGSGITGEQPVAPPARPDLPGPPPGSGITGEQPVASPARPDLPGPPPAREFDSAPPASGSRPPLPGPPPTDGPPPWLAGPTDQSRLGLDPAAPDDNSGGERPNPEDRHWLPSDEEAGEQPGGADTFAPVPDTRTPIGELPDEPDTFDTVGEQPGAPGTFAAAEDPRTPIGDQPLLGERRDPGQAPDEQGGAPGAFAPAAGEQQAADGRGFAPTGRDHRAPVGDQPAPGERRDPGLFNQPPAEQSGTPGAFAPAAGSTGGFAPAGRDHRAPIGDQPAPGERRDPGLFNQPPAEQGGAPGAFAPATPGFAPAGRDHRAPIGDQPAPGERRDPGVFNQPPAEQGGAPGAFAPATSGQPGSTGGFAPAAGGQPSNTGGFAPATSGQPGGAGGFAPSGRDHRAPIGDQAAPGERRDPGVFNQPPGEQGGAPGAGQAGERRDPNAFNGQPNAYPASADGQAPGGYPPGGPAGWQQGANQQPPQGGGYRQPPPGQWNNGPRPGGPQPSLDDVPLRRAKKAPGGGWRKAVHHISGGTINPGMSAEELRLQELVARIRQPVRGDYRIAVLSLKGGVGKTTTTMGLGSIYASIRGDRVIAVDANPDFGTLSQRVPLQTRSTVRDLLLDPNVERYSDVRKHTSQATSRLEVLASERDPAASEQFNEHEYRAVARILQRYYNIILTDCGTGLTHSAMGGVLDLAHSLVLISSAAIDGARSAASTLDWLSLHGHDHLVRNAVVVINLPREGSVNVGIQQLREYFLARCRAVHIIPFDDHLSEGAEIDLHRLSKQAKRAYVELAATVADEFNVDHRHFH